ncbi:flagellar hook-length control protein FliK [Pigmentiphaga soli]|uniref:Flagellar hook-length control protein FliK n=1 Tax=Pigmentiphaga soli TaxID=1007095 RepID=A0ABP8HQ29_9BURK
MNRRRKTFADPAAQTATLSWLGQDGRGASLLATARRLMALQREVEAVLQEPLRSACRVLRLEDGNLTLGVPAATHSAKLRQLAPRIAAALEKQGWQVNGIAVRVQASLTRPAGTFPSDAAPRHQPHDIGPDGLQAFADLRQTLPQGRLAQAIEHLLARRQKEPDSN